MNTKMLIYGAVLTGLFCAAALACLLPPPCPPCTRPSTVADPPEWPDCVWKCGINKIPDPTADYNINRCSTPPRDNLSGGRGTYRSKCI